MFAQKTDSNENGESHKYYLKQTNKANKTKLTANTKQDKKKTTQNTNTKQKQNKNEHHNKTNQNKTIQGSEASLWKGAKNRPHWRQPPLKAGGKHSLAV